MIRIGRCGIFLILVLLAVPVAAIEGEKEVWKKEVEKLHYGDERSSRENKKEKIPESDERGEPDRTSKEPETQGEKVPEMRWRASRPGWLTILGYIGIGVVLIVLLYFIVRAIDPAMRSKRVRMESGNKIFEDNPESLAESELDRALREALNRKDYRLAVRIRFLQALKHLEEMKVIQWKKSKTNREYLTEARAFIPVHDFKTLILMYEQVWFGDMTGNHKIYEVVEELAVKLNKTNDA